MPTFHVHIAFEQDDPIPPTEQLQTIVADDPQAALELLTYGRILERSGRMAVMRYRLRTLLFLLAVLPPLLAVGWIKYSASLELARQKAEWERSERKRIYHVTDDSILLPVPPMPKKPKQ